MLLPVAAADGGVTFLQVREVSEAGEAQEEAVSEVSEEEALAAEAPAGAGKMKRYLPFLLLFLSSCSPDPGSIRLLNTDQEPFSLSTAKKNRATVLIFLSPECPLSQNYILTLNSLNRRFADHGVAMYGVFPGKRFSQSEIKEFAESYKPEFALITDHTGRLKDYLEASVTPEAFVLNPDLKIIYSGRIDNWAFSPGKHRRTITEHDLENALSALLQNKAIPKAKTHAVGCLIE
jgi:peroxiredoxin